MLHRNGTIAFQVLYATVRQWSHFEEIWHEAHGSGVGGGGPGERAHWYCSINIYQSITILWSYGRLSLCFFWGRLPGLSPTLPITWLGTHTHTYGQFGMFKKFKKVKKSLRKCTCFILLYFSLIHLYLCCHFVLFNHNIFNHKKYRYRINLKQFGIAHP